MVIRNRGGPGVHLGRLESPIVVKTWAVTKIASKTTGLMIECTITGEYETVSNETL